MSYSISLPLDGNYLRRECPRCERQFKWYDDSTDEQTLGTVEAQLYYCPYCGEPASSDEWWTQEQVEYIEQNAQYWATRELRDEFDRSIGSQRNSLIEFSIEIDEPELPRSLVELDDMSEIQSPCHPTEPIKIEDFWVDPIHCLICGERFALG